MIKNFLSDQVTKAFNSKLSRVGEIADFDLSGNDIKVVFNLKGETVPVELRMTNVKWSVTDDDGDKKFNLHFDKFTSSKIWLDEILIMLSEKMQNKLSFPDQFALAPVKMMFPKK